MNTTTRSGPLRISTRRPPRGASGEPSRGSRGRRLVAAAAALGCLTAAGAAPPPVSALRPVELNDGINIVAGFLPDGSAATIVRAWRANGNAHGFHVLLVLAPQAEGHGAGVVTLMNPDSGGLEATISDNPFDGERVLSSVRFAFGEVRGKPASLMLRATLDNGRDGSLADHATALVRIFRVETTDGGPGDSPLEFRMLWSKRTTKLYCNSQLAMRDVLSVPLPANFAGPNRVDGCFDR